MGLSRRPCAPGDDAQFPAALRPSRGAAGFLAGPCRLAGSMKGPDGRGVASGPAGARGVYVLA
ncbi:MAG: hypothetical protein ACHQTF_03950, partial [Gemmatimonadales bacterium]